MPKKNVLVVAFSADPLASMESRLGWQRALGAAKHFNTWLLCEKHDELTIEAFLAKHGPIENLHVHYVERTPIEYWMYDTLGLFYFAYHRWHRRAYEQAKALHEKIGFDLVHQANFCGYREPGYCWKLDAPFVWGPVGGTQDLPFRFLTQVGIRGAVHEFFRSLVNALHFRYRRRVIGALRASAKILVANTTCQRDFGRVHGIATEVQLETGIIDAPEFQPNMRDPSEPLNILWSGRYQIWKALPLLLKALARRKDDLDFRLRVIAHGPRGKEYQRLSETLGINDRIEWVGWPDYFDSYEHYAWADVFAFTSLRDTSGTGLLEALAHGCPIVGIDHQGAHDIMSGASGVRIPVTNPKQVIADFGQTLIDLSRDPERLQSKSIAAWERSKKFHWDQLNNEMMNVYREVLELEPEPKHEPVLAVLKHKELHSVEQHTRPTQPNLRAT